MGKGKPSEIWKEIKPRIGDMVTAANDMEQSFDKAVREAYQRGYDDAQKGYENGYENGMIIAWEAARKITGSVMDGCFNYNELNVLFGSKYPESIIDKYSASECIEKIRAYEQEKSQKEEQSVTAEEVMRQYLDAFCKGQSCTGCPLHTCNFTCGRGHHFLTDNCVSNEEVRKAYTTVLQKMRETK